MEFLKKLVELSKAVKYTKLPPGNAHGSESEPATPWKSKPARPNADAQASRMKSTVKYTKLPPGNARGSESEPATPWKSKPARPNADSQAARMKSTAKKKVEKGSYTISPSVLAKLDRNEDKPWASKPKRPTADEQSNKMKSTTTGKKKQEKWVEHRKGNRDSQGKLAEWVVISNKTGKVISSERTKAAADKRIRQIETFTHEKARKSMSDESDKTAMKPTWKDETPDKKILNDYHDKLTKRGYNYVESSPAYWKAEKGQINHEYKHGKNTRGDDAKYQTIKEHPEGKHSIRESYRRVDGRCCPEQESYRAKVCEYCGYDPE